MALRSTLVLALATVLAGVTLTAAPAAAQSGTAAGQNAAGRVHASSYAPVPADTQTSVRPWDNSAANLRLKAAIAANLHRRGVKVAEGAALAFNFETEVEDLSVPDDGPSLGQVMSRNHDSRVRMNFWSTTQDSVTQGRRSDSATAGNVRYILRATLDDTRSGTRLWQGEASYTGAPADELTAFGAMVPVLVEAYGETVRVRSFQVD